MTRQICILGIDPGASGAMAFYFPKAPQLVSAEDLPAINGRITAAALYERIFQMGPDYAVVEAVHSMPGQGVASTFKFGRACGTIDGVLGALKVPVHYVTPSKWKSHFRLSQDKDASRTRAIEFWPARAELFARKKDHNRAEAALLARWGAEEITGRLTLSDIVERVYRARNEAR